MSDQNRSSKEEDKYILKAEQDRLATLRQERQLAAIRQQEREEIAVALDSTAEIAAEALELGFDGETAPILPFIPILQVAWADGTVSRAERKELLGLAARYGISEDSSAIQFLELLITERPTATFFERVGALMSRMVKDNPDGVLNRNLLDMCEAVAKASGGFFGYTNPIGKEERALLEQFASKFSAE